MLGTGLVHIYYGDGKGKTTAAMGQAIRAAGSGLKVLVFQFMKDNSSSERKALEMIPNITLLPGKRHTKFYNQMNSEEKAEYRHYNTKALDEIAKFCINFDVLVMDEAVCAVDLGLLSEEKLVKFVKHKPRGLEIVMTGHHMTDALFEWRRLRHRNDQSKTSIRHRKIRQRRNRVLALKEEERLDTGVLAHQGI